MQRRKIYCDDDLEKNSNYRYIVLIVFVALIFIGAYYDTKANKKAVLKPEYKVDEEKTPVNNKTVDVVFYNEKHEEEHFRQIPLNRVLVKPEAVYIMVTDKIEDAIILHGNVKIIPEVN